MNDPTTRIRLLPGHAGRGRGGVKPRLMVMHVQEGLNDLYPEFLNRPASNAADCTIWSKQDGTLDRFLYDSDTAWTNGDVSGPDMANPIIAGLVNAGVGNTNAYSYTVEHQGFASSGFSDAQIEGTSKMVAYWCSLNGWVPSRDNVVGHYQVGPHKQCPGPKFPFDKVIARAKEIMGGTSHVADNQGQPAALTFPTGKILGGGFKRFYDKLKAAGLELLTFGYPVTNEFDCLLGGKTRTVQLGERAGMVFEPENKPPWDCHFLTTTDLATAITMARSKGLL